MHNRVYREYTRDCKIQQVLIVRYSIQNDPEMLRVTMEGPFTFMDARAFRLMVNSFETCLAEAEIRINMKRLESIDAMALGLLLIAFDAAKKNHRSLVFEEPQGQVHEALSQAARHNALAISA